MKLTCLNNPKTPQDAKADILDYIDQRLCEWATWALEGARLGIGYPPCSLEYRLMKEGHVERSYQGLVPIPEHANAEEIEGLLCEMAAQNQAMAKMIQIHYLEKDIIQNKASKIGIGYTQFQRQLMIARWWLAGRLSDKGKVKQLTQKFIVLQNFSNPENAQ